jgi:hypothetical protein
VSSSGSVSCLPRAVLDGALEPVLSRSKSRIGYFLRAESFFNVAQFVDRGEIHRLTCRSTVTSRCTSNLTGESFLALAANRFGGQGLYILDEPEAALFLEAPERYLRAAADEGRYAEAVLLATDLSPDARHAIKLRIANRVARRALAAIRSGDLGQAHARLGQADRFRTDALTRRVVGNDHLDLDSNGDGTGCE